LEHIQQLQPFFEQNEDMIACVETGFLGPWGEQHTSKIVTQENIKKVTEELLKVVPESRTVNVRKPLWYCATTSVDIDHIDEDVSQKGSNAYRIGMFNDGYLGSASDLGSFSNREKALTWLSKQATHTLYGGEVALSSELDANGNKYHSIEHIQEEMFRTHTSYINEEWNDKVINEWKQDIYTGKDVLYQNKSAYLYVKNHLGYRLVIKECEIPETAEQASQQSINVQLKNVGAGNVVNEKDAYILLKNDTKEYAIPILMDIRNFESKKSYDLTIPFLVEETVEEGDYDIYLKFVNKGEDVTTNKRTIRFANENIWNEEIGANKIGKIQIVARNDNNDNNSEEEKNPNEGDNKNPNEENSNTEQNDKEENKEDNSNNNHNTNSDNTNQSDISSVDDEKEKDNEKNDKNNSKPIVIQNEIKSDSKKDDTKAPTRIPQAGNTQIILLFGMMLSAFNAIRSGVKLYKK